MCMYSTGVILKLWLKLEVHYWHKNTCMLYWSAFFKWIRLYWWFQRFLASFFSLDMGISSCMPSKFIYKSSVNLEQFHLHMELAWLSAVQPPCAMPVLQLCAIVALWAYIPPCLIYKIYYCHINQSKVWSMFIKKSLYCHFTSIIVCSGCYQWRLFDTNNICLFSLSSYVATWDNSLQAKKLHNAMYNGETLLFIGKKNQISSFRNSLESDS